ncbi:MAG TPA: hypothetical protein VI037_00260 [Nitrososphaera sp.]
MHEHTKEEPDNLSQVEPIIQLFSMLGDWSIIILRQVGWITLALIQVMMIIHTETITLVAPKYSKFPGYTILVSMS